MIGVGLEDHTLRTQPVLELSVKTCPVFVLIVLTQHRNVSLMVPVTPPTDMQLGTQFSIPIRKKVCWQCNTTTVT